MERIMHVRYTSLRIHSVPLLPLAEMRTHKVTQAGSQTPGICGEIGWLEQDHNRHLSVLTRLPVTLSAIVGHQGRDPVLGICPRQPYLLLALSVLGFLPARNSTCSLLLPLLGSRALALVGP